MDYLVANKECPHTVASLSGNIPREGSFLYLQKIFKEFLETLLSLRAIFLTNTDEIN